MTYPTTLPTYQVPAMQELLFTEIEMIDTDLIHFKNQKGFEYHLSFNPTEVGAYFGEYDTQYNDIEGVTLSAETVFIPAEIEELNDAQWNEFIALHIEDTELDLEWFIAHLDQRAEAHAKGDRFDAIMHEADKIWLLVDELKDCNRYKYQSLLTDISCWALKQARQLDLA